MDPPTYMMYFFLGAVYFYCCLKMCKNKIKTKSEKVHFIIYVKKRKQELGGGGNTHTHTNQDTMGRRILLDSAHPFRLKRI